MDIQVQKASICIHTDIHLNMKTIMKRNMDTNMGIDLNIKNWNATKIKSACIDTSKFKHRCKYTCIHLNLTGCKFEFELK